MSNFRRRLYALIVRLHPATFRNEFGREMALDFEDTLATYGFACLFFDATRSLARQWTGCLLPEPEEQQPIPRHPLLAGQYVMIGSETLTPFELARGSVLFAVLFFAIGLATNTRSGKIVNNLQHVSVDHDGGMGNADDRSQPSADEGHRETVPRYTQVYASVGVHSSSQNIAHGSSPEIEERGLSRGMPVSRARGSSRADLLWQCVIVSAIIWLTSFLLRRSRGVGIKVTVTALGLLCIAASVAFGQVPAQPSPPPPLGSPIATAAPPATVPSLDVISVKPDRTGGGMMRLFYTSDGVSAANVAVHMLLTEAYHLNDDQIVNEPAWAKTDHFDIEGKVAGPDAALVPRLTQDQRRVLYQQVLTERFGLVTHNETRELPEYALTVVKGGPRLQESKPDPTAPTDRPRGPMFRISMNKDGRKIDAKNATTDSLLRLLSNEIGRTVIDKTGLTGKYDFTLSWSLEIASGPPVGMGPPPDAQSPPTAPDSGPSLFTAIQEQLGLKLEPIKGPVDILVIDHVEKPSPN